ncbi:Retrovirus-related Pol polyprotein from transposon TNT 1-94 [Linum perenne]
MPDETDADYEAWDQSNNTVVGWIINSLASEISELVIDNESAYDLWKELQEKFGEADSVRIAHLRSAIASCTQGNSTVTEYFNRLKGLWTEYISFRPIPPCECGGEGHTGVCNTVIAVKKLQENDHVIDFIIGLNADHENTKNQLLLMDPPPDLKVASRFALKMERQVKGVCNKDTKQVESVALAAPTTGMNKDSRFRNNYGNSNNNSGGDQKKELFCRYCKKDNHMIEDCLRLKWKRKNERNNAGSSGNFAGSALTRQSESYAADNTQAENMGGDNSTNLRLSTEDCTRLMVLLQQSSQAASSSTTHQPSSNSVTKLQSPNCAGRLSLSSYNNPSRLPVMNAWIVDTGASDHMCCSLESFMSYRVANDIMVTLPNGTQVSVCHVGTAKTPSGIILHNALHIPSFTFNLISVSQLTKTLPVSLHFESNACLIQDLHTMRKIGSAREARGLYQLDFPSHSHTSLAASSFNFQPQDINIWHFRLGHPSNSRIQLLNKCNSEFVLDKISHCEHCHFSRQKKLPFPLSSNRAVAPFDLIHTDIWGPVSQSTYDGNSYFLTIVDDHSRAVWAFLMKHKSETRSLLQNFCIMIQRQFDKKIRIIRSDQGQEFHMRDFYAEQGIYHQTSCVERQQQNGRVERKHQDILNTARALKFQSGLPLSFWGDCVLHSVHILNRLPTTILSNKTPFEVLYGTKPDYSHLRVFGCLVCVLHSVHILNRLPTTILSNKTPFEVLYGTKPDYSHLRVFGCLVYASSLDRGRTKFHSRARQGIHIGLAPGIKGFKVYDIHTKHIFVSRDVMFHETIFPFKNTNEPIPETFNEHLHFMHNDLFAPGLNVHDSGENNTRTNNNTPPEPSPSNQEETNHVDFDYMNDQDQNQDQNPYNSEPEEDHDLDQTEEQTLVDIPVRRSTRQTKPPSYLDDYVTGQATTSKYPISAYTSYNQITPNHKTYAMNLTRLQEPNTYDKAVKDENWRSAMKAELQALEDNHTWEIVDCPKGKKPVGCKWVYKIKLHADGRIERYKARLVAKGFTQVYGIDFLDTFSPVVKMNTVKLLLAVAAVKEWHLEQLDISNAFLHGDLDEEVYMELPPGMKEKMVGKACKLKKSLYGLKQASRQWFSKLTEALVRYGFTQSVSDYSLFTKKTEKGIVTMLVYVDDLIIAGDDELIIQEVKQFLAKEFKVRDLGKLKYFLGLEIARSATGISVCQRKYSLELLQDTGYIGSKPINAPTDMKTRLSQFEGEELEDITSYRRLLGRLNYLVTTRPDIAFAVQQLCQFQQNPRDTHVKAAHRILRYVKKAPSQGLFFSSTNKLIITGYCDADWGACPDTRRSITGYCTFLGESLITWKAKKQHTVSKSSSEAEYRSMAQLACELQWLKQVLMDLQVDHTNSIKLHCDNKSAIHMAENPVFHERTKHIEIDCHVIRERVKSGLVSLHYVPSDENLADIFTKGLSVQRFEWILLKLGVYDIYSPACGGISEKPASSCITREEKGKMVYAECSNEEWKRRSWDSNPG